MSIKKWNLLFGIEKYAYTYKKMANMLLRNLSAIYRRNKWNWDEKSKTCTC